MRRGVDANRRFPLLDHLLRLASPPQSRVRRGLVQSGRRSHEGGQDARGVRGCAAEHSLPSRELARVGQLRHDQRALRGLPLTGRWPWANSLRSSRDSPPCSPSRTKTKRPSITRFSPSSHVPFSTGETAIPRG